jgi:hypothetical protein
VEREFQGLRYHCLSHVHLLAVDHVEYGARGFVGLRRHVCGVRHLKGNKKWKIIDMLVRRVITMRASRSATDEGPPSTPETEDRLL